MENKTDKPYSHKQAKNDIAKKYGYESWFDINFYQVDSNNMTTKAPYSEEVFRDEAAELYASKATEELRKENERLNAWSEKQNKFIDLLAIEIERLKESNKELVEALHRIASRGKGVLRKIAQEALAKKSEGEVNKKI